jgi:8-hydroxy-5-deazaflavin:NADPH oxidoreductase
MKIGIIGSGIVGQQLGLGLTRIGNEVIIGTRDGSKLNDWKKEAGGKASVGSNQDAAKFGEAIVLATAWSGTENAISITGKENFSGKILIDVTNPLDFSQGSPPKIAVSFDNSGAQHIQKWLPDAKVVKAFNIINAHTMINPKYEEGDPDLFIAGNDGKAKEEVASIAKQLGWINIIDLGDLSEAIWLETLTMLWVHYGFKFNNWTHAFKLLKK